MEAPQAKKIKKFPPKWHKFPQILPKLEFLVLIASSGGVLEDRSVLMGFLRVLIDPLDDIKQLLFTL